MSNEKEKTAVEQLAISLYEGGYLKGNGDEIQELVDKAKEMEKKQIIDDWRDGFLNGRKSMQKLDFSNAREYYNETYGNPSTP
jgi:uncharacterized protein YjgD (DUF1641 family)